MSTLTSTRLSLRPMDETDETLFMELFCSDNIMANIGASFGEDRAKRAFAKTLKVSRTEGSETKCWTIFIKHEPQALGIISFSALGKSLGADIGIMLSRHAQGKLVADEAVVLLAQHGFNSMGLAHIRAEFMASNLATKRITRKLKFTEPQPLADKEGWQQCFLYPRLAN
ncbi:GNAT family N-acetyltransferase [Shewanella cyperi]|uniref:GNAT family N-acetyltransferase n=1 Tax=Shewanella cyperi TaxID=2814292 RepID=UPI001A9429C1|nr:GNAT family N-acetyltransferase [Shewanella cyperi]QSX40040.1 GNAT family N-acetyltransferase [Shewanella cyperi]